MKLLYNGCLYESDEGDDYLSLYDELENNPEYFNYDKTKMSNLFNKWVSKGLDYDIYDNRVIIINNYDGKGTNGFFIKGEITSDISGIAENILNYKLSYANIFPNLYDYVRNISSEFWDDPSIVYHATNCDNVDDMLEEGLNGSSGTGLGNRNTSGVFTSLNSDGYIESYGDCVFSIDTVQMKNDGYTPEVEIEPEILEYNIISALNHILKNDEEIELSGDIDFDTIIIGGNVPPKYLKLVKDS